MLKARFKKAHTPQGGSIGTTKGATGRRCKLLLLAVLAIAGIATFRGELQIVSSALANSTSTATSTVVLTKEAWPTADTHVLFLGDSLMRYSFLEWLDYHHFQRSSNPSPNILAPDELINEKLENGSWIAYLNYTTLHFEGYMACDCRRKQVFDMGSAVENRYYSNPERHFWATYLQGFGNNYVHGRFLPPEDNVQLAQITGENDTAPYKWVYLGKDWDQLLLQYTTQLQPFQPTSIVLNCGHLWPCNNIARYMGNILRAARQVVGCHGHVIWRSQAKRQWDNEAPLSDADVAARDFSLRMPGITFQPFPRIDNLTKHHYSDHLHFSEARIYHQWNQDLNSGLQVSSSPPKHHRVFILVGAVRTLHFTQDSILQNWIVPLCSPYDCIAHLVTHFSYTDNRPGGDDPKGKVVDSSSGTQQEAFFQNHSFPQGFLQIHPVEPGYNIASPEEQQAMGMLEKEQANDETAKRMRILRLADPRRYSMWFARAWAYRFAAQKVATQNQVDFYAFSRPDLFWTMPVPTVNFFQHASQSQSSIFVHDSYYGHPADTLAMLPNAMVAEIYFSMEYLVRAGVMCLGGPNLNRTLVEARLKEQSNLVVPEEYWCQDAGKGWSEQILGRRFAEGNIVIRQMPVATTILRPPHQLDCQPLKIHFKIGEHSPSYAPLLSCLAAADSLYKPRSTADIIHLSNRPFRLRGNQMNNFHDCLAFNDETGSVLTPVKCQKPIPANQMFVMDGSSIIGHHMPIPYPWKAVKVKRHRVTAEVHSSWSKEPVEMYSFTSLDPATVEDKLITEGPI